MKSYTEILKDFYTLIEETKKEMGQFAEKFADEILLKYFSKYMFAEVGDICRNNKKNAKNYHITRFDFDYKAKKVYINSVDESIYSVGYGIFNKEIVVENKNGNQTIVLPTLIDEQFSYYRYYISEEIPQSVIDEFEKERENVRIAENKKTDVAFQKRRNFVINVIVENYAFCHIGDIITDKKGKRYKIKDISFWNDRIYIRGVENEDGSIVNKCPKVFFFTDTNGVTHTIEDGDITIDKTIFGLREEEYWKQLRKNFQNGDRLTAENDIYTHYRGDTIISQYNTKTHNLYRYGE